MIGHCSLRSCPALCAHPEPLYTQQYSVPLRQTLPGKEAWYLAMLRLQETGIWPRLRQQQQPRTEDITMSCDFR